MSEPSVATGYEADLHALLGLTDVNYKYNLDKSTLFDEAIANDRGRVRLGGPLDAQKAFATKLGKAGPLVYFSDPTCTGRPVQDTYGVAWPGLAERIWWKTDFKKFDPDAYASLLARVVAHLNEKCATLYVKDVYSGNNPSYARPYRFVGEFATHAYFTDNMFAKDVHGVENEATKRWTMLNVPSFVCDPERDGTLSERAVILDARNHIGLVVGPADYCGIVKKTMFTVMNFVLPDLGHLSMHCSSNVGARGDGAILFGLSGTGKTTLSADPDRDLIGDDEHAWTEDGISNLEDGCYAKLINLSKEDEPVIAAALSMPGTLIENVPQLDGVSIGDTDPQDFDLFDNSRTENTRFSYPLTCNPHVAEGAQGPHPETIVLLTADAFGVLPPVSVLDEAQVMYHFVMGFTSKLAGTEVGVTEPKAVFSACFGAPFMPHKPSVYAKLLGRKMREHKARCILLNTGWAGGPHGVGKRIALKRTRAMLNAALCGALHAPDMTYEEHPILKLKMPTSCPGLDDLTILNPRSTWADKDAYDVAARRLLGMFHAEYASHNLAELGIPKVM